jgi:hypothetical protein
MLLGEGEAKEADDSSPTANESGRFTEETVTAASRAYTTIVFRSRMSIVPNIDADARRAVISSHDGAAIHILNHHIPTRRRTRALDT